MGNRIEISDFSPTEIELVKHLCRYDIELKQAVQNIDPKVLSKYLFQLATMFNNFYEKSPILKEKNVMLANYRALILNSTLGNPKAMHEHNWNNSFNENVI